MVKKFLRKRLSRLAIPYLFWSSIYLFFSDQPTGNSVLKFFSVHWIGFGWSGQYYLLILAFLTLIYPLLRLIKVNSISLIVILSVTLASYILFKYLSVSKFVSKLYELPFIYWIFYVYLGIYSARNYEWLQQSLQKIKISYRFYLLLIIPLAMVIENYFLQDSGFASESYSRILTILASTLVFLLLLSLEDCLIRKKASFLNKFMNWLSAWTLGIYCLNPLVVKMAQHFQLISANTHSILLIQLMLSVFNCFMICFIALTISILINQLKGGKLVG